MSIFFNKRRIITWIVLAIAIFGVIKLNSTEDAKAYSDSILPIVTIFYVYFTLEILETTKKQRPRPYVDVTNIVITSDLDDLFLEKYSDGLIEDDLYSKEKQKYMQNGVTTPKNYIFLRIDNVGEKHALNLKCHIEYHKIIGADDSIIKKDLSIGVLKHEKNKLKMFEVFETPNKDDQLKIIVCEVTFSDDVIKNNNEKEIKKTIPHIECIFNGEQTLIKYINN